MNINIYIGTVLAFTGERRNEEVHSEKEKEREKNTHTYIYIYNEVV